MRLSPRQQIALGVVLFVLGGAIGRLGDTKTQIVEKPVPTVLEKIVEKPVPTVVEKIVEKPVPTVLEKAVLPQVCRDALEQGLELNLTTMDLLDDTVAVNSALFTAMSEFDMAEIERQSRELEKLAPRAKDMADQASRYATVYARCQAEIDG